MRILVLNTLLTFCGQHNWCECGSYFVGGVDGDETSALLRTTHFEKIMQPNATFPNVMRSSDMVWPRRNSPGLCTVRIGDTRFDGRRTGVASWTNAVSDKHHGQTTTSNESNNKNKNNF